MSVETLVKILIRVAKQFVALAEQSLKDVQPKGADKQ